MIGKLTKLYLLRALRPKVIHRLPGRLRVHVSALKRADGQPGDWIEEWQKLLQLPAGIRSVELDVRTGNALLQYDPDKMAEDEVLDFLQALGKLVANNWDRLVPYSPEKASTLIDILSREIEAAEKNGRKPALEALNLDAIS